MNCTNENYCTVCGSIAEPILIPTVLGLPEKFIQSDSCRQCRDFQSLREDSNLRIKIFESRKEKSGIPKRFWNADFGSFRVNSFNKKQHAIFMQYHPGQGSIFVSGPPGTGKTHLSIATLIKILESTEGIFSSVPDLLFQIKNSFSEGKYFKFFERIRTTPLLVLDDIGAEKPTEWVRETLFSLIDFRYQNNKPIIFTSNFHLSNLENKLGKPIISRIVEMCRVIKLDGEDFRLKIRKEILNRN